MIAGISALLPAAWLAAAPVPAAPLPAPAPEATPTPTPEAPASPRSVELEVLYHADLDGRLAAPACGSGTNKPKGPGYAALISTLSAERARAATGGTATVTLLGGNEAGPDPLAVGMLAQGTKGARALASVFARGGYDALALGHHELSLEPAQLDALLLALEATGLPVIASNVSCDRLKRPACASLRRSLLVRRGGTVTGVLATLSPSVIPGLPGGRLAGIKIDDPVAAIRDGVRQLRAAGASRVLLMTQGPRDARALDEIDALQRKLSEGSGPDLVLAGGLADEDTGRAVQILRREGAPPVVGSTGGAVGLSRVRLGGGEVAMDAVHTDAARLDAPAAEELAAGEASVCKNAEEPIAPAPVKGTLSRDDFVKYVLQVMRRRTGAEIALLNNAFVKRVPFPIEGLLTRADLDHALPYRAVLGAARVEGPVVDALIGAALGNPKLAATGIARGKNGLEVNGRPLDKAREYRVVTIAFVAEGGDGIFPAKALPFHPLPGAPDLRDAVEEFLRGGTASEDGDPTVDPFTDFGPPPVDRPLVVALADVGFDFADTSIANAAAYTDPQLARAQQTTLKGEATVVAQLRQPVHEADGRFDIVYGWSHTKPAGQPAASGETVDLITATTVYTYRGLRDWRRFPKPAVPDPYARLWLESEVTRPEITPTQIRDYHHAQLTPTVGGQFTLTSKLKLRGGAGAQKELLAPGDEGRWRAVLEASGSLDPTAIATWGALAVRLEGLFNYDFVDPTTTHQHQLRATGKLSVPLVPYLFITAGVDVFAVQRQQLGWSASYDTTIGLRLHFDAAHQPL